MAITGVIAAVALGSGLAPFADAHAADALANHVVARSGRPMALQGSATATHRAVAARVSRIKLMNYFPSNAGWDYMWTRWNATRLGHDMGRMRSLGANAVRIIVRPEAVGYPVPKPSMLAHLSAAIRIAQEHGLRIQLTLFDGWHDWADVTGSESWAASVLSVCNPSRLIYIDLHNEIDREPVASLTWARALLPFVQGSAHGVPVTVSVTVNDGTHSLTRVMGKLAPARPDLYDVHYYASPELANQTFLDVAHIADGMPVVIGETGASTNPGSSVSRNLPPTRANAEAYQSFYLRSVQTAAKDAGLPIPSPWVFQDFRPDGVMPGTARHDETFLRYGLLRANGTLKPGARAVETEFHGSSASRAMNGGFEQMTKTPTGPLPLLWRTWLPGEASISWDGTVAHTGRGSLRISDSKGTAAGWPGVYVAPIANVRVGRVFRASGWARGTSTTGSNRISIAWLNARGVYLGQTASRILPSGSFGWRKLEVEAVAPSGAAAAEIHLESSHNSGTVWFDDIAFGG